MKCEKNRKGIKPCGGELVKKGELSTGPEEGDKIELYQCEDCKDVKVL